MAQFFEAMTLGPVISMTGSNKMGNFLARANQKDLVFIKELLEAGKIVSVIDKRYTLAEVADALRYFGEGHTKGKVVITVNPDHESGQTPAQSQAGENV